MVLPVIDFSRYDTSSLTPPNLMQNLQQGMQTAYMPRQLQAQQQQMNLKNQLMQNQANYAPQMSEQELKMARLRNALGQNELNYAPQMSEQELQMARLRNSMGQNELNYAPQMSEQELKMARLRNSMGQNELNYAPQMSQATLAQMNAQTGLTGAQAKRENIMANLPFGGASLPGVAGSIQGLETVKQLYGEDSPQYQMAKKQFDLEQQNTQSRVNYQNSLSDTMPMRYLTQTGKGIVEQANVGQGNAPTGMGWSQQINPYQGPQGNMGQQMPQQGPTPQQIQQMLAPMGGMQQPMQQPGMGGQISPNMQGQISPMPQNIRPMPQGQATPQQIQGAQGGAPGIDIGMGDKFLLPKKPIAPGSPEELSNQYALDRLKKISDPGTRERALYAHNMEVTMKNFNVDDLVHFSGLKGGLELKKQEALDAQKKPTSPEFKKFTAAQTSADLLAHQVRQFYKDSIQPSMIKKLEEMTNPSSWVRSPETAKRNYLQIKSILGQEMKTYNDALKSPSVYTGKNEGGGQSSEMHDPLGIR